MPSESLGSRPGSVVTGRDREVRGAAHNWPSVTRVREGLVGRGVEEEDFSGCQATPLTEYFMLCISVIHFLQRKRSYWFIGMT